MGGRWRNVQDWLDDLRHEEEAEFDALALRYSDGHVRIVTEREERIREGNYGKLPR